MQQAKNSPHPIGVNFQSACPRVLNIGGIQKIENKSQKLHIYIYQERKNAALVNSEFWIMNSETKFATQGKWFLIHQFF